MAGSTELFRLAAKLVLDDDDFVSGISGAKKEVGGLGRAFSGTESGVTKLSSALNVMQTVAGATGAALRKGFDIGKTLVESAASMSALDQSMATTFEGVEEEAAAAFKAVGDANNIAERRLQESGLAFYRQFLGAGMDSANAMVNMENALGYAADAAAAYDISLEDASQAMRSFVRGNTEAGEAIGIFVSEKMREDMAMEEYGKKWKELNEAERQYLLLDLVGETQKQNKVVGQGAREAYNYTNVVGNLQKAWEGAMASMGDSALPHVTTALQNVADWIEDNPNVWAEIGAGVGWIAEKAAAAVGEFGELMGYMNELGIAGGFGHYIKEEATQMFFKAKDAFTSDDAPALPVQPKQGSQTYTAYQVAQDMLEKGIALPMSPQVAKELKSGTVTVEPLVPLTAAEKLEKALESLNLSVPVQAYIESLNPNGIDWTTLDPSLINIMRPKHGGEYARGLEYVPHDGFPATLHRGETVLTRVEAEDWRAAQRGGMMGFDPAALGAAVAAAMAGQLRGLAVNIDGHTAGTLLTPYVSKEQYNKAWKKR